MLNVTNTAAARLAQLLDASPKSSAVRIVARNRRLKLRRDHARSGDATFAHAGRVVLVLDERMARALSTRILDTRETTAGPKLRLQRQ
jgi:hypothetical protein